MSDLRERLRDFATSEDHSIERMAATAPFPVLGDIVMYREVRKEGSRLDASVMTASVFLLRASIYTSIVLTAMDYCQ